MDTVSRSKVYQKVRDVENIFSENFFKASCLLLALNLAACIFVIRRVPYTEIDWIAYMEEVSGVINDGELDYKLLRGGTGPLVYPAGFVYIYSLLYVATDHGANILLAQYLFAVLHTATQALVLYIYWACYSQSNPRRFPLWIVGFLFTSRRVVSLFVLRLFNDCIEVLLMYLAIVFFIKNRWSLGCLVYSLSVSVKMNALLFAPGLAILLCQARGTGGFIRRILGICLTVQLVLGAPFLLYSPTSYLSRAFELTRKFFYKWSVNGAFLSEPTFLDSRLALALLVLHLGTLLLFGQFRWTSEEGGGLFGLLHMTRINNIKSWFRHVFTDEKRSDLSADYIVSVLFASNFIGIAFARTLHYQFYVWYAHTIPYLVCSGSSPALIQFVLILAIEVVFNIYPPRASAAILLNVSHFLILVSLWRQRRAVSSAIFRRLKPEKKS